MTEEERITRLMAWSWLQLAFEEAWRALIEGKGDADKAFVGLVRAVGEMGTAAGISAEVIRKG